ncbi:uncharacterized protein LOC126379379 [Pectinophora gossypiella]|uniref:uncharacterized protein LOC126379379 n=1 Tax=Pectinophora gossypiella TaxID=13191 RepID=UPI00214E22A9|nr:uncharacterized protein LOC126379379 [Pectinophora gossypiella]
MDGKAPKKAPKRKRKKKTYPSEKKVVCNICGQKYYWECKLAQHMLTHTGEKPYKCPVKKCGKAFNSSYSLKTHSYIHSNQKPFQCSYCPYACRDSSTLRRHQDRHMGIKNKYECKICSKTYNIKATLKLHVAEVHCEMDVRKYACEQCDRRFKTKCTLTLHVKNVHNRARACTCPICGAYMTNKANLPQHLIKHTNQRPYICAYPACEKSYKDPDTLKRHARIHYPEQQHSCETCGKMFTRLRRLEHHWKTVHNKRRCVECDYCGQRFYSKSYLINHIQRKHGRKKKRYKCDHCKFVTLNKPSIVMHIKYGHGTENDRECHICHTIYKRHVYLKMHYAKTHGIRYKTKPRAPPVEIKEEPEEDEVSIDLFEIEKEEPDQESNLDPNASQPDDTDKTTTEENVQVVSKNMFEDFFIQHVVKPVDKVDENPYYKIDTEAQKNSKKSIQNQITEVRRKEAVENVERTRQIYNERMKRLMSDGGSKEKPIKIKFFKKKYNTNENNNEDTRMKNDEYTTNDDVRSQSNTERTSEESNKIEKATLDELNTANTNDKQNHILNDPLKTNGEEKTVNSDDDEKPSNEESNDDSNDEDYKDEERKQIINKNRKVKFNTHQCYVCFKLFSTLEQLLEHCKDHFDICTEKSLKKCPLCDYVSKKNTAKHLKTIHGVSIKVPYGRIQDKKDNTDGCRYYFEIDNPIVDKIEVIPSLKNLNKIESMKIDKRNREDKDRIVSKTKLVKKGKEWVVEKEKVDINSEMIPKLDSDVIKSIKLGDKDSYFDGLKKMYHAAKKSGTKIMFPCQHCDKICQNLSALKLHSRKHDPNKKPFKPKVWKHKVKKVTNNKRVVEEKVKIAPVTENRTAKPQPIKNKHKCDPKLKEFYENNIRGGDIEFWQFLKIYNKMDRENITDFNDLKGRYEFGIGHEEHLEKYENKVETEDLSANTNSSVLNISSSGLKTQNEVTNSIKTIRNTRKVAKTKGMKRFKSLLSKEERRRRILLKNKLRESAARNMQLE